MVLIVSAIVDEDWQSVAPFLDDAFSTDSVWNINFPYPRDDNRKKIVTQRFIDEYKEDPDLTYLKVVDDGTGDVVSAGAWAIYIEDPFKRDGEGQGVNKLYDSPWWGDDSLGAEHCSWVNNSIRDRRRENSLLKGRAHCYLFLAGTDPSHERRGGASALVRWGTSKADDMDAPCIVDASRIAHKKKVYEKHGFRDIDVIFLQNEEKYPGKAAVDIVTMYRPAQGKRSEVAGNVDG